MAGRFARSAQRGLSQSLFWLRRRLMEPTLDPDRDSVILPVATYSPWLLDRDFQRVYGAISSHTLVDPLRCWELWHLVGQVAATEGDLLEVGVWRGGTGCLLASRVKQLGLGATVHLCDTFEGVDLDKITNTARMVYNTVWILANDADRLPPPRD